MSHARSGNARASWGWFVVWVTTGAAAAIGAISFGAFGLALVALIAGVALAARRHARGSAWGLLSGAGLIFLVVAYLQRDGPGTTCWQTARSSGCSEHLDPRPWLVAGLLLVIVGVAAQFLARSHGASTQRVVERGGPDSARAAQAVMRVTGVVVFSVAAALLTSIGGLGILASPITLPVMYAVVRVHPTRAFRAAGVAIGTLTALEGGWGVGFLLFGYDSWATFATMLAIALAGFVVFWRVGQLVPLKGTV